MFVISIEVFGVKEKLTINDSDIILSINKRDFKDRLKFVENINIETLFIENQLLLIASLTNKLSRNNLTPPQKRALICFLENKLKELK